MKVLICKKVGGAFGHITDSWVNTFNFSPQFTVKRYDGNINSWQEYDPDLFIGCSGHWQPIPNNRRAKIAIHVNPYGDSIPGIDEPKPTIDNVKMSRPDVVFGYGFETHRNYWKNWEIDGIKWVPMPTAGDAIKYQNLKFDRPYDVVYLGGRWSYKAQTIDKYLLPIIDNKEYKTKIAGWGDWHEKYGIRGLDEGLENAFFNMCRVAPCISEIHTYKTGIDLPERYFKTVLAGCAAVHDGGDKVREILPEALVANDPTEYAHLVNKCVKDEYYRMETWLKQYNNVINNHTYHHRLSNLLRECGFVSEANNLLTTVRQLAQSRSF